MAGERIAIFGAGSVGCFIGGAWAAAGLPVTFVGRTRIAAEIDRHGLTLSDYAGWRAQLQPGEVDYRCGPEAVEGADVIALCVKSGATDEAARQVAEHGTQGALVVSFQNGVSNVDRLGAQLRGRFEIARGMVPFNVAHLGDGRFHKGVAGELWAEDRPLLRGIAERVAAGPVELKLSDDMLGIAWGKLLINLNNAVNALSGRTLIEELRQRPYRQVVAASMKEGLGLLKRAQVEPAKVGPVPPRLLPYVVAAPDILFNSLFLKSWKIDAHARSSMSDDLAAGRATEVDYLNGELVALADKLQVDAPVNRAIVELVRKAEAGAAPLSPRALRRAVLGR